MKTLMRTFIILVAALVVIGALFAFAQTSLSAAWFGAAAGAGQMMQGQLPAGVVGQHPNEGGGAGITSLMPVLKNAGIMSVLAVIVIVAGMIPRLYRRSRLA